MDSQKLKMLLDFLISKPEIQLAILFGSVAHKTDTAISDIDLAIAGNEKFSIDERLNISLSINKLIGKEVDLIDLMQARGAIFHSAMNTGIPFIQKFATNLGFSPDTFVSVYLRDQLREAGMTEYEVHLVKMVG